MEEAQLEALAEQAATKALQQLTAQIYQEIGKKVVFKLLSLIGVAAVSLYFLLKSKNLL